MPRATSSLAATIAVYSGRRSSPMAKSYPKSADQSPATIGRSRIPQERARARNARSRARASSQSIGPETYRTSLCPSAARWSTAMVTPSCWSTQTRSSSASRSGLTTSTGTSREAVRTAATEAERGVTRHSASMPRANSCWKARSGLPESSSSRATELTE
jgi:hypothetical protein